MIRSILSGIKAYKNSFKLIGKLGLWKYFGVPMAISFFTAIMIGFSAWGLGDNVANLLDNLWFWEWGAVTYHKIAEVVGTILIIAIGLILYKHIVMALSAPFMSPVSEKIEKHFTGNTQLHRNTTNSQQLWRGIRINLRNLLMELLLSIPIFLIGLIPIIGVISTILLLLVQSYYAGFGNMDYTLERHLNYNDSIKFVKQNRGMAIGNGIVFMLFLLIPVVGIILVLPFSVTAASIETLRKLEHIQLKES